MQQENTNTDAGDSKLGVLKIHDVHSVSFKRRKKPNDRVKFVGDNLTKAYKFLETHPILFDRGDLNHHNKEKKETTWKEFGEVMNKSSEEMKQWYNYQRSEVGRLTRKPDAKSGKCY